MTKIIKQMKNDKRGVAGMNLAKGFVIGALSLVVIGMLTLLVLGSFHNLSYDTYASSVTNESSHHLNSTSNTTVLESSTEGFILTGITAIYNVTDGNGTLVPTTNYSFLSSGIVYPTGADVDWDDVNISYGFTYTQQNSKGLLTGNVTLGLLGLFAQFPTLFTILGVVMLVLLIIVIIVVINRLGGSKERDYTA